ncbi:MAG: Coenzyme F420 hydrogenase/dehydrogenase, beta subunit C-terminal domain [Butyrivibrio sp.]|nr:Coenzyme F420 hydrogenase/dehydrogenase, beta subunit C-terminal domain [Butyrivibrio sp.]
MITKCFAAYCKDEKIRDASSSGGIFYYLAKSIIDEGGVVFGAAFDENWEVKHIACDNLEELPKLMKSKYVQSDMGNAYELAKNELLSGRKVLFCGTPCQAYGLISFLTASGIYDKVMSGLYTMDFVCHGVPSRMVWRKYLEELSSGKTIKNIDFRDKTNGWRDYNLKVEYADGPTYIKSWHKDSYSQGFVKNLYLRESCYNCAFRGVERKTDITIADFWGVHKVLPDFFDDKGASTMIAHSEKGVGLIEKISDEIEMREIEKEIIIQNNSPLVKSVNRNDKRDKFFSSIKKRKISTTVERLTRKSLFKRVIKRVKRVMQ